MDERCPDCGGPISSSTEDVYCAELCGWRREREVVVPRGPWIKTAESLAPPQDLL